MEAGVREAGPRRVPEAILEALLPDPDTRDAVLGDLLEDHDSVCGLKGPAEAARWYWTQVVWSAPALLQMTATQMTARAWLRACGVVLLGYMVLAALVIISQAVLALFGPLMQPQRIELLSLAASTLCGVGAGYAAACIGRSAPLASSLGLGVVCTMLSLAMCMAAMSGTPLWYRIGLAIVVLPATTLGGLIRVFRSKGQPAA
jgi:hypothetical protein